MLKHSYFRWSWKFYCYNVVFLLLLSVAYIPTIPSPGPVFEQALLGGLGLFGLLVVAAIAQFSLTLFPVLVLSLLLGLLKYPRAMRIVSTIVYVLFIYLMLLDTMTFLLLHVHLPDLIIKVLLHVDHTQWPTIYPYEYLAAFAVLVVVILLEYWLEAKAHKKTQAEKPHVPWRSLLMIVACVVLTYGAIFLVRDTHVKKEKNAFVQQLLTESKNIPFLENLFVGVIGQSYSSAHLHAHDK